MPGLEKELFQVGQTRDATDYEEVKKKLTWYVGVNFKHGASISQWAMENLETPTNIKSLDQPAKALAMEIKKWKADFDDYHKER